MIRNVRLTATSLLVVITVHTASNIGLSQRSQSTARTDAALQVEGQVKAVYARQSSGQSDRLVQIAVRRAEAIGDGQRGVHYPAPGESLFVLVDATSRGGRLFNRRQESLPEEGADIRAYLSIDADGAWRAASSEWFEPLDSSSRATQSRRDQKDNPDEAGQTGSALGMSFEVIELRGRLALRVSELQDGGVARSAGLEIGDVIIGVNGQGIDSLDQLRQRVQDADQLNLAVIDVNSGRLAEVTLGNQGKVAENSEPAERPLSPTRPATPALGISAERVSLGLRSALKVLRVEPGSPAEKAGLEIGDVLVKANGVPLTAPDQLVAAIRKSDGRVTLSVRDVRSGREVPVDVDLTGGVADGVSTGSRPQLPTSNAAPSRMGVVTELAFFDVEATIKITEVEPGSPADRAGLQPGDMILEANGQKLLHPNDLAEVERAGGRLALTVVDPRTGRKQRVNVDLSR